MTVSPHDAEEQLRPYLGRLFDARTAQASDDTGDIELLLDLRDALDDTLTAALRLLGVPA